MKKLPAFLLTMFIVIQGLSQSTQRETVTQSIEWFVLNSNIKLHRKFGIAFDAQFRFAKDFQSMQHFLRPGLEIYIAPNFSIVPIGYMYVWNYSYGEQPAALLSDEQRIWEQVVFKQKIGRFNIHHRARLEQRFLKKVQTPTGEIDKDFYLNRVRYRLLANYPINKNSIESGAWFINVWDEIFYGWGDYDTYNEPDQNRLSLGLGYQLNSKTQFVAGGLHQILIKNNGAKQENNIGILIQFTYNLDLSKKEETK